MQIVSSSGESISIRPYNYDIAEHLSRGIQIPLFISLRMVNLIGQYVLIIQVAKSIYLFEEEQMVLPLKLNFDDIG